MIRQSIACDICGAEKKETKHWFVALEQVGELRIWGWSAGRKSRAGAKHLCGQTCLHRLVDDFMAGTIYGRAPSSFEEESGAAVGKSAGGAEHGDEFESSARLIPTPVARPAQSARPVAAGRVHEAGPYAPPAKVSVNMVLVGESAPAALAPRAGVSGQPPEPGYPPPGPQTTTSRRGLGAGESGSPGGRQGMQLAPMQRDAGSKAAAEPSLQRRRADAWARERAREPCPGERPPRVQSGGGGY